MSKAGCYEFLPLEQVIFGKPAAKSVLEEADRLSAARVMIVATKTVNRKTDIVTGITDVLDRRCVGVFDECIEHTPRECVIAAADAARACDPDLIVTVGGGSAIDMVKVMQICLAEDLRAPADLEPYYIRVHADGSRSTRDIKPSPVRQIAVPTTLSGAEFSNMAASADTESGVKHLYIAWDIGPRSVILDPELSLQTPESLWLSTGVRGLDHAVEGVCSIHTNPYSDALNLQALRLLRHSLPQNKAEPGDLLARLESQQAVWLSASGIGQVPYGASHGIGHALGSIAQVPYGHSSCAILPAVLRYNEAVTNDQQRQISIALGRPGRKAADAVAEIIEKLGMPSSLRDLGVAREQLARVAEAAVGNPYVRTNPRTIGTASDIREILEAAW